MTLGEKLAKLRREQNLTQEQLAELLGVSRQAISKWESNTAYPETEKMIRLAKLYYCSLDYLILDEPMKQENTPVVQKLDMSSLYIEKVSEKKIGNLPLWHVNVGYGRVAKGVFALGLAAKGVVSVGLFSIGLVSAGVMSIGALAFGSFALGLVAVGAIAAGLLAFGAVAVGLFAAGASAIGYFAAGAAAVGKFAALGDSATAAVAIGISEARGSAVEVLTQSWDARQSRLVADWLDANVPSWLKTFKELFLWFCSRI